MRWSRFRERCIAAVALALLLSIGGVLVSQRLSRNLVDEARGQAFLAVQAFAQAAAAWIGTGSETTLRRVGELMITGSSHYVQIVADDRIVLDLERPGFQASERAAVARSQMATTQLVVEGRAWFIDTTVPLPTSNQASTPSYARAGIDAQFLAARLLSSNFRISSIAVAIWIFALAAHWAVRRRMPRTETEDTTGSDHLLRRGDLLINTASFEVSLYDEEFRLTPNQLQLLQLLASEEQRVFNEKEILEVVWPTSRYADSNNIRQCVHTLRTRLRKIRPGTEECIVTVKGFGYSFDSGKLPVDDDSDNRLLNPIDVAGSEGRRR